MALYVVNSLRPLTFSVDADSEEEAISLAASALMDLSDDQQYEVIADLSFEADEDEPYEDEDEHE